MQSLLHYSITLISGISVLSVVSIVVRRELYYNRGKRIHMRTLILLMLLLGIVYSFSVSAAAKQLAHGDGTPDGKQPLAGTGAMVHFSAPVPTAVVTAVHVHSTRRGGAKEKPRGTFKIYIFSKDLTKILHTEVVSFQKYRDRGRFKWYMFPFKKPVTVPKEFWVVVDFNTPARQGIFVSYDTSTGGKHSLVGIPGQRPVPVGFKGDWMVKVDLK